MTPRRLLALAIWGAAAVIWADALAPGSPLLHAPTATPRHDIPRPLAHR